MRIALLGEHASPLAVAGGVVAGGQNIYLLHVARPLAQRDHALAVYPRRELHALGRVRQLHEGGNDTLRRYGADRARVSCIPCGVARREFDPRDRREVRRSLQLSARTRRIDGWERVPTELETVYESIISQEDALEQTAQSHTDHESAEVVS